jgi:lipoyl-dependent peroxiredoxin
MAKVLYTAEATVTGSRDEGHGTTTDGKLDVTLPQVADAAEAVRIVAGAHQVCPYSNATRGNIEVKLTANGQPV